MSDKHEYSTWIHNARFNSEEKCRDFLMDTKWNNRPQCPDCGNNHLNYYLKTRKTYKCSTCYRQFSLTQGTIFENSKIPLTKWFYAIYLFTTSKRGISSVQMAKWLGIRQKAAWFMLQRLREALKEENNAILQGIVEADETFIKPNVDRDTRLQKLRKAHYDEQDRIHGPGKGKARRQNGPTKRGVKKGDTKEKRAQRKLDKAAKGKRVPFERCTVVLGMLERGGKTIMKKLGHSSASVNRKNIYRHLENHISTQSILVTDQLSIYYDTKFLFTEHQTVNHKIAYVINGIHINGIENSWTHLKKMILGTYFHLSKRHFDRYLDENTYRWNRRDESLRFQFDDFIRLTHGKRITYKNLIQRSEDKLVA